jgi:hypothetical protein
LEVRRVYRVHREQRTVVPFMFFLLRMIAIISAFAFTSVSLWIMIVSWRSPHLEIHKNVYFTYSERDAVSWILFKDEPSERLTIGYPYDVSLECEVPECPNNLQMGPANIVLRLFASLSDHSVPHPEQTMLDGGENPLFESARHLRLIFRGEIVAILQRICLWPLYVMEWVKERQHIIQPMMEMVTIRGSEERIARAKVVLLPSSTQSRPMEVYGCMLHVQAHLGWMDYWIVHHPWIIGYAFVMLSFGLMSFVYVEWNVYVHGRKTLRWALLLVRRISHRFGDRQLGRRRRRGQRGARQRAPSGSEEDHRGSSSEHGDEHVDKHGGGIIDVGVDHDDGGGEDASSQEEREDQPSSEKEEESGQDRREGESVGGSGMEDSYPAEEEEEEGEEEGDTDRDDGIRRRRLLTDAE